MKLKTCKICKNKYEPLRPLQQVCSPKCAIEYQTRQKQKAWNKEKKEKAPYLYPRKYKSLLAKECQKLARMIDIKFGYNCVDCDRPFGKQVDGGHFKSKGSNASLSYNLHNIHSQRSECNRNGIGGGRERQYYDGLVKRYGLEYAEMVDIVLQQQYKYIGLKENEVAEKLVIVRKLIRDFDTFDFVDSKSAREIFNKIIGIYK